MGQTRLPMESQLAIYRFISKRLTLFFPTSHTITKTPRGHYPLWTEKWKHDTTRSLSFQPARNMWNTSQYFQPQSSRIRRRRQILPTDPILPQNASLLLQKRHHAVGNSNLYGRGVPSHVSLSKLRRVGCLGIKAGLRSRERKGMWKSRCIIEQVRAISNGIRFSKI